MGVILKAFVFFVLCSRGWAGRLKEVVNGGLVVSNTSLEFIITKQQWKTPSCVIFSKRDPARSIVKKYIYAVSEWVSSRGPDQWKIFYSSQASHEMTTMTSSRNRTKPSVVCYIGDTNNHRFIGKFSRLRAWLEYVGDEFLERPKVMTEYDVDKWIIDQGTKYVLLIFIPGKLHFVQVAEMLKKIPETVEKVLVLPDTEAERMLYEKFGFAVFPTTLIFNRDRPGRRHRLMLKLEGFSNMNLERILLTVQVLKTRLPILTEKNFDLKSIDARRTYGPLLVLYFTPYDALAYKKLNAFERAYHSFRVSRKEIRFAICDVSDSTLSYAVATHMPTTGLHALPIIGLYLPSAFIYKGEDQALKMRSRVFNVSMPTPWLLEKALEANGILDSSEESASRPNSKYLYCSGNNTDVCSIGDFPEVDNLPIFGPFWDGSNKLPLKKPKRKPMKIIWNIPVIDSYYWKVFFERSETTQDDLRLFTREFIRKESNAVKSRVIIYIMADCQYCQLLKLTFQRLRSIALKQYDARVYMVNCTSEPEICSKNAVYSFPTVVLYRSYTSKELSNCFTAEATNVPFLRIDYFDVFEIDNLLQWVRVSSSPSVVTNLHHGSSIPDTDQTVQLVATVMSSAVARQYLPRSLEGRHFPFMCFKVLCKRLYSVVDCVAQESELSTERGKIFTRKDLVVSEVAFRRKDGAEVFLFKVTKPMENTLNDDGGQSALHKFHKHHRYGLPHDFYCEDDHSLCVETMHNYILDHYRLPVTAISHESFHVRHRNDGKDALFSGKLPVLIALISRTRDGNSSFFKSYYEAAQRLYLEVTSTSLDVEEYPHWASRFVPRNYMQDRAANNGMTTAPLFHFPRLCIVNWSENSKAAFYPSVKEMESTKRLQGRLDNITSLEIVKFTREYLANPNKYVIDTETY